jgi:proteasome lid subunit RPN8/RPN11
MSLTVTEEQAAWRMLADKPPKAAAAICDRLGVIDACLAQLGPRRSHLFYKLRDEASRLRDSLADVTGMLATTDRAASGYVAAERAWWASAERAPMPASWRLPERPRAKVVEAPTIRLDVDIEPRVTVHIARSALDAILTECRRDPTLETGGWLIGRVAPGWHKDHDVLGALPAAKIRTRDSVALDPEEFRRTDARLLADGGDFRCVGDWHTHPTGGGRPSPADVRCQARDLATFADHNHSLTSLILTERDSIESWTRPHVSAWITRFARSSFGEQMVCEPAKVAVR